MHTVSLLAVERTVLRRLMKYLSKSEGLKEASSLLVNEISSFLPCHLIYSYCFFSLPPPPPFFFSTCTSVSQGMDTPFLKADPAFHHPAGIHPFRMKQQNRSPKSALRTVTLLLTLV